ncbi:DNA polymerase [Marinobacterium nitratireducens]|uniref:DNA polymerase n=1 Tax=Marinobacterium nitratireducens TaxID=518897 RepID=A0A917ZHK4_9GAMM|nr:DNA polymerase II [Marinobacterium nitratireducens]GGO83121.1 DNA polymerase [Marinobacterium nitratireducens]
MTGSDTVSGFILSRQQRDTREGIALLYWISTDNGPVPVRVPDQDAVLFVHQHDDERVLCALEGLDGWRLEPRPLKDLTGAPVAALYCRSLKLFRQVSERLRCAGVAMLEDDIRPVDRYLMERFIQGGVEVTGPGSGTPRLRPCDYRPRLKMLSIDLETSLSADRILSIGLSGDGYGRVLLCGSGEDLDWLEYVPDERRLLERLMEEVASFDPDIFIGWNVIDFDFRVLEARARALGLKLRLGRDGDALQLVRGGQGKHFVRLGGRLVVDGIDTLRGATYQFESFSLEFVARELLGRGKLIDHVDARGAEIQRLYREDPVALARYNLEDCALVQDIFARAQLLHYLIERCRLTGLALDKVGGSAAAFDNQYLPRLHRAGYVAAEYASGVSGLSIPGGFVMDSRPGLYRQVLVLDFKSLYPSIIRTFCVDPCGLAEGLREGADPEDLVPGFNGAIFARSRSILPSIIERLWQARDEAKRERNAPLSQAIKIIMNSFYGVLGSNLCRFYDQRLSGSITLRGHEILNRTRDEIERHFGFTVIYGDTDSVFVWLGDDCSDDQAQRHGQALAGHLNGWWRAQLEARFGLVSFLEIQYESHFRRFLMPRMRHSEAGSKKRYAGLKRLPDGGDELVFKGLENVRTDWTPLARRVQHELYERVFREQPYEAFLRDTVARVFAGELDEELVYRKRLRRPLHEYRRNRPPQVQAALKAEQALQQAGRQSRLRTGSRIEYLITVNGPEPLDFRRSPIDYQHYIDRQLKPVVDTLLPFLGRDFDSLVAPQLDLF